MNTNITFNYNVPHVLDLMLFVLFILFTINKLGFLNKTTTISLDAS